ncbi:MAG: HEAT repeat domain-containing protein [Deltaproteobacteria bacterium]|nr:HEAT repeat domain-containing protein [Deltaproteobacteria bacterium]
MRRPARWSAVSILVIVLLSAPARADKVDDLARTLASDPSYKVRVQAALVLGKLGDKRAVPHLIKALKDSHPTVRAVSCGALGRLGDASAVNSLKEAAKDEESMVRQAAEKALQQLQAAPPPASGKFKYYISLGGVANKAKLGGPEASKFVREVLAKELARTPNVTISWEGGAPDAAALKKRKMTGYYLDGSIIRLSTSTSGNSAEISCDLKMFIATYPAKSMIMFTSGGAAVQTGSSAKAEEAGRRDCLEAAAQAVHQNVVTFLKSQE